MHSGAVVRRCSPKYVFFKFLKISHENICVGVFLNKVTGLKACNFFEKKLLHKCSHVNFSKFLRTAFFTEHPRGLLLKTGIHLNTIFFYLPFLNFLFVEASTINQPCTQSNFKNIAKKCAVGKIGIKGLLSHIRYS